MKLRRILIWELLALEFKCKIKILIMNLVDQVCNYIIRPNREKYHINRLGPAEINLVSNHRQISVVRYDLYALNLKRQKIFYSLYFNSAADPNLCVFYLHANNGSRVQGLEYTKPLLQSCFNVCLLDFTGSGISDGDYVTLGLNEAKDLHEVFCDMRAKFGVLKMVLWGRSMGACTALIYSHSYPSNVESLVLDSPFKDLRKLVKEIASERTGLPKFMFEPMLGMVDGQLESKIGYQFKQYKMKKYLSKSNHIPALFLISKVDKLVKPNHGQKLFNRYLCPYKQIEYISVNHHQTRDITIINACLNFIRLYRKGSSSLYPLYPQYAFDSARQMRGEGSSIDKQVGSKKFSFKEVYGKVNSPVFQLCPLDQKQKQKLEGEANRNEFKDKNRIKLVKKDTINKSLPIIFSQQHLDSSFLKNISMIENKSRYTTHPTSEQNRSLENVKNLHAGYHSVNNSVQGSLNGYVSANASNNVYSIYNGNAHGANNTASYNANGHFMNRLNRDNVASKRNSRLYSILSKQKAGEEQFKTLANENRKIPISHLQHSFSMGNCQYTPAAESSLPRAPQQYKFQEKQKSIRSKISLTDLNRH